MPFLLFNPTNQWAWETFLASESFFLQYLKCFNYVNLSLACLEYPKTFCFIRLLWKALFPQFLSYSVFGQRKTTDFCVWILYPATLLKVLSEVSWSLYTLSHLQGPMPSSRWLTQANSMDFFTQNALSAHFLLSLQSFTYHVFLGDFCACGFFFFWSLVFWL